MTKTLVVCVLLVAAAGCSAGDGDLSAPATPAASSSTTSTTAPTGTPEPAPTSGPAPCPAVVATETLGRIENADLTEISGLAVSNANPGVLWGHNDSGGAASLFAMGRDGSDLGEYPLVDVDNRDWEDMAEWVDPGTGTSWLYVADSGDNLDQWPSVFVHRVPEPVVSGLEGAHPLEGVETFEFTYPDGPQDAETLLVDPATGTITIVTKNPVGSQVVFQALGAAPGVPQVLVEVGRLDLDPFEVFATSGDQGADRVFIRTPVDVLAYPAGPAWWSGEPCQLDAPFEVQGESIAADPGGGGYVTVSEGRNARLNGSTLG